jgi:hypothetical protein
MGAAHGGQILVSQAIVDSVADRLPGEIALRDLGGVRPEGLVGARAHRGNKGKLVGQKAPLKVKDIWAIRIRLQIQMRTGSCAVRPGH